MFCGHPRSSRHCQAVWPRCPWWLRELPTADTMDHSNGADPRRMIPERDALGRLRAGNRRFVLELRAARAPGARRHELTNGQEPFAIILGCSDSRVPAEIVFDQGLGDLFVIRVAGNIVA